MYCCAFLSCECMWKMELLSGRPLVRNHHTGNRECTRKHLLSMAKPSENYSRILQTGSLMAGRSERPCIPPRAELELGVGSGAAGRGARLAACPDRWGPKPEQLLREAVLWQRRCGSQPCSAPLRPGPDASDVLSCQFSAFLLFQRRGFANTRSSPCPAPSPCWELGRACLLLIPKAQE